MTGGLGGPRAACFATCLFGVEGLGTPIPKPLRVEGEGLRLRVEGLESGCIEWVLLSFTLAETLNERGVRWAARGVLRHMSVSV